MQEDTARKVSAFPRMEKLRIERGLTWEELARKLGVSVSLLYQVRRGASGLSDRTLHRLTALENDARTDFAPAAHPRDTSVREPPPTYRTSPAPPPQQPCRFPADFNLAERLTSMENAIATMSAQVQTLTQLLGATLAASVPHVAPSAAGGVRNRKAG
jgi:transcriptional regulator with XRE-family HTH domain